MISKSLLLFNTEIFKRQYERIMQLVSVVVINIALVLVLVSSSSPALAANKNTSSAHGLNATQATLIGVSGALVLSAGIVGTIMNSSNNHSHKSVEPELLDAGRAILAYSVTDDQSQSEKITIKPIIQTEFAHWLQKQAIYIKNLVAVNKFTAKSGTFCLITNKNDSVEQVLLGVANKDDFLAFGVLPEVLPASDYYLDAPDFTVRQLEHAAIGWGMGSYSFDRYKARPVAVAKLSIPERCNKKLIKLITENTYFARDLINTPASVLYPERLASIAEDIAKEFGADIHVSSGQELQDNFPAVYAVGRGSLHPPVLIDMRFGDVNAPKVVLVGKGVCFDGGGLDLKDASGMRLMKTDMAGATHVLALARMIMTAKLPINLRVIIPAVENLVSSNPYKPGDVIVTRQGLSVEVASTDAEGRLILADALTLACEWHPQLLLDFATLTGAARVALGEDISALFASDDHMANSIIKAMTREQEPTWRLPLYQLYFQAFDSAIADFKNLTGLPGGGAITAALFLQQFVDPKVKWAHFDINAYNLTTKPAMPEGGEAYCLKGVFAYLEKLFNKK